MREMCFCNTSGQSGGNMPSHSARFVFVSILVIAGMFAIQLWAQGGATGAITGTVQDPSGAVVANAEVRIVNQETGAVARTVKTDANGAFAAPLMPVGTYTVVVSSAGFKQAKFPDV